MTKYIHQILPSFSKRDAVGNDTFLMREALRSFGFKSEIFHEINGDEEISRPLEGLKPYLNRDDTALIFHFSIGSDFPGSFVQYSNQKIIRYHNITPPEFFCVPEEEHIRQVCARGRQQIRMLAAFGDVVFADSAYNGREFSDYSPIPVEVVPILRDYERLRELSQDKEIEKATQNAKRPLVLFVGRICPNKAQHDLLKLIALYKRTYKTPLGLVLVGGFFSPAFQVEIEAYARYLDLDLTYDIGKIDRSDVVIMGSISDEQLTAFYRNSTVFCSLSDHEGFGVPLVEAMSFNLPILAHSAAAVPETIGSAGCLIDKNDWVNTISSLHALISNGPYREQLTERGRERLSRLSIESTRQVLKTALVNHRMIGPSP